MNMLLIFQIIDTCTCTESDTNTHVHKTVQTFFKGGEAVEMKWGGGVTNCSQCINRIFFDIFFFKLEKDIGVLVGEMQLIAASALNGYLYHSCIVIEIKSNLLHLFWLPSKFIQNTDLCVSQYFPTQCNFNTLNGLHTLKYKQETEIN